MFDHSAIAHFINHIGRNGFSEVFGGLSQDFLRIRPLSVELDVESSTVMANVSSYD